MTILMYHKVCLDSPTIWWVSVDGFYQQMVELKSRKVVYLDDYNPQDPNQVVITFDGIYENVFNYALPILNEFDYPFELFVTSDYLGRDNSFDHPEPKANFVGLEKLKIMVERKGRLQWHTKSHTDLTSMTNDQEIVLELKVPDELRQLDKKGFKWFAYPYGKFNQKVVEEVKNGFIGAVSCHQGNDTDIYCLNRITVTNSTTFKKASTAVIIASYNYGSFLVEAVESVLRQTRMPDEILITDDASDDNTYEIAEFYQHKYPHLIQVNRNAENLGIVKNFNKAVRLTNSDYITILGADNRYRSDFIEKTSLILDQHPDVGIAYSDFALFGARAKIVYETQPKNRRGLIKADQFFIVNFPHFNAASKQALLTQGNFIHGSSMFRRKAFKEVGGYIEKAGVPEDYNLFARVVKIGWNAKRVPFPILEYRQHSKNQTNIRLASFAELQFYKELTKVLRSELHQLQEQFRSNQIERKTILPLNTHRTQKAIDSDSENPDQTYNAQEESHPLLAALGRYIDDYQKDLSNQDSRKNLQVTLEKITDEIINASNSQWEKLPLGKYLNFILYNPYLFLYAGEADKYYNYMSQWIDYLHRSIFNHPDSDICKDVAIEFSKVANFIPLYFNEYNLKKNYIKRSDIIEYALKINGFDVDYEFEDRPVTQKKIRLGILAARFNPSAETFASLPVYEYISRDFEVILYSINQTGHPLEDYCRSCANSFKQLPQDLKDQVNVIRADDLDILFIATNVTAVTNQICLLSLHRLARVQVTSGGSVVTTGIRHVDYYISGQLTDPSPTAQHHYREKLVKLEGTAHCFSYGSEQEQATVKVERDSLGLSEEKVIFISGANFFKIIPELIDTWARIIAAVPNSVLVLLPFGPNWSNAYPKKSFLKHLSTKFTKHGVTAERLVVLDPQPVPNREDIKEYYKIADVYLDSYPFSATTSLIEPLEVGLPVIARQGTCFRSAMGAALLKSLDIPDLVADSEEAYIQLAIALGTNPELRQRQSEQIKQKMQTPPPFLDSRAYSAKMGALFQELFRNYQADALSNNLRLRDINLIIFPDWSQPEELIAQELANVIRAIATHPDKNYITLLINTSNISEEDADLAISSVVMNLLMEEELEVEEGPEISILGKLSDRQWEALLTRLQARIVLENENQGAIAQAKVDKISVWEISSLTEKRAVQQETGNWVLEP